MKQKLLLNLIALLSSATPIIAQSSTDYIPLVREGARWDGDVIVEAWEYSDMEYHPYSIIIDGDTIINNLEYKKCHYLFTEINQAPCQQTIMAFLREDIESRKVYAIYNEAYASPINTMWNGELYIDCLENGFNEVLLYDFNNPTNPDLYSKNYGMGTISLDSTTYITTNDGITRQCHHLHNNGCYIEGIGYVGNDYHYSDLLFRFPTMATCPCNTKVQFMRYYDKKGTMVYNSPISQYPYPYEPLVREGVRWEYLYIEDDFISDTQTEKTFWIEMKGDSVINNTTYKKCLAWSNDTNPFVLGLVREDESSRKVYRYDEYAQNSEILLYDFNDISKSEPLIPYNFSDENITISQSRYAFHYHDKFTFSNDNEVKFHIIEGIGFVSGKSSYSTGHLLNYLLPTPDSKDRLITFRRLVTSNNDITIYETPAGIERVSIDQKDSFLIFNGTALSTNQEAFIEIYNLSGHQVANTHGLSLSTSNLPTGLYIARATTHNQSSTLKIIVK